jgi:hypothetical protein
LRKKVDLAEEEIKQICLLYKGNYSSVEIGNKCHVGHGTILNILRDNDVHIRTASESQTLPDGQATINYVLRYYKYNAKIKEIPWELLDEFVFWLFKQPCRYCKGMRSRGRKNSSIECNGIDRKNSDAGYIISNVVPCCTVCNDMKGTLSEEEFLNQNKKINLDHDIVERDYYEEFLSQNKTNDMRLNRQTYKQRMVWVLDIIKKFMDEGLTNFRLIGIIDGCGVPDMKAILLNKNLPFVKAIDTYSYTWIGDKKWLSKPGIDDFADHFSKLLYESKEKDNCEPIDEAEMVRQLKKASEGLFETPPEKDISPKKEPSELPSEIEFSNNGV